MRLTSDVAASETPPPGMLGWLKGRKKRVVVCEEREVPKASGKVCSVDFRSPKEEKGVDDLTPPRETVRGNA